MKVTELRIGNHVLYRNDKKTISAITKTEVSFQEDEDRYFPIKSIEPIPLTRERVKQLSFELFDDTKDLNVWRTEKGLTIIEECIADKWENFCFDYSGGRYQIDQANIKYVHHLQNICADLTGEELILKG